MRKGGNSRTGAIGKVWLKTAFFPLLLLLFCLLFNHQFFIHILLHLSLLLLFLLIHLQSASSYSPASSSSAPPLPFQLPPSHPHPSRSSLSLFSLVILMMMKSIVYFFECHYSSSYPNVAFSQLYLKLYIKTHPSITRSMYGIRMWAVICSMWQQESQGQALQLSPELARSH